jgi:hypothetical protein
VEIKPANPQRLLYIDDDPPGLYRRAPRLCPTGTIETESFVLCDAYIKGTTMESNGGGRAIKSGSPILYFRADTSKLGIRTAGVDHNLWKDNIYNFADNMPLFLDQQENLDPDGSRDMGPLIEKGADAFYGIGKTSAGIGFIQDKHTPLDWPKPYNSDSYLLISAGQDGLYGTADDITNFGN